MDEAWRALGAEAAASLQQGRGADAAALFRQLTELRPDDANGWFNLGYSLRMARRYDSALEAYGEALARGVRSPEEARINRAVILADCLHRTDEAASELEQALGANPRFVTAWLNLGNLREDLGDADAAREAYRQALMVQPGNGRAVARLAALDVHQGQPERAVALLNRALPDVRPRPEDLAEVHFALGSALDAGGHFPEAFAAVRHANEIAVEARAPAARYDRAKHAQLVDALIAMMPPTATEVADVAGPAPVFVCGMFRSGSTLAEQLLGRHSRITPGGELEFVPALVSEDLRPYPTALAEAAPDRLRELRSRYLEQLQALFPAAEWVTDKRPDNFLHIGLIKALFPTARIVHTIRHPLDNILSVYFLYFAQSVSYSEQLDDIVHYYAQYRRLMAHWEGIYGDDIVPVRYEALVRDPRSQLEPVLRTLGLDWDESMLSAAADAQAVRTASVWQIRQPLHTRSSGRWGNYQQELSGVQQQLAALGLLEDDA